MIQDNETRKAILKGQCVNIAFQDFNATSDNKEIKLRIQKAHDIYNELMNQNFLSW